MPQEHTDYEQNVFINCPFDKDYKNNLLYALVFAVHDCGFRARCTLEISDAGQIRIQKIFSIIAECRFGIHDISRTELDDVHGLPRFNMPLELGMFLGAKEFGQDEQKKKSCMILDIEKYRYQKFCSDIAGQDIGVHEGKSEEAIEIIRNWLRPHRKEIQIPSGSVIFERYRLFTGELPKLCKIARLNPNKIPFYDMQTLMSEWMLENQ